MILELVKEFIKRSGGLSKVEQARDIILSLSDSDKTTFARKCVQTEEGAQQLVAAALVGFALISLIARSENLKEDVNILN